jgi:very-short-patch-repair endonuclease
MTEAETMLWSRLRLKEMHGVHFRRQRLIGPYIADFACIAAKLVVEIDGVTHARDEQHARDVQRDAYMTERGWRVVRLKNEDVYKNLDGVFSSLLSLSPPPPAAPRGAASTSPATAGRKEFEGARPWN